MTDLPKALRLELASALPLWTTKVRRHHASEDGTEKLLLETADGETVECVLLRDDKDHRTACISTQIGCAMGCTFCATGMDGLVRNLTKGEILEQLVRLAGLLPREERLSHVVVMGMGEPLANLDNLLAALETATSPKGLGISARRITISTVGLPRGIRRLGDAGPQYHLAVSLHAPNDTLRNQLIPANRNVGIGAILEATDDYFAKTRRRVTFEVVLLAGVNDSAASANELANLLCGKPVLVNLIPFNPVPELPFETPSPASVVRFAGTLENAGIAVQTRFRKGDKIEAACGQLRRRTRQGA